MYGLRSWAAGSTSEDPLSDVLVKHCNTTPRTFIGTPVFFWAAVFVDFGVNWPQKRLNKLTNGGDIANGCSRGYVTAFSWTPVIGQSTWHNYTVVTVATFNFAQNDRRKRENISIVWHSLIQNPRFGSSTSYSKFVVRISPSQVIQNVYTIYSSVVLIQIFIWFRYYSSKEQLLVSQGCLGGTHTFPPKKWRIIIDSFGFWKYTKWTKFGAKWAKGMEGPRLNSPVSLFVNDR